GGTHTWDNLVAACKSCNHRKGGKTPEEARVRLLRVPFETRSDLYSMFTPYLADERNEAWRTYLFLGLNKACSDMPSGDPITPPEGVRALMARLWEHGHAAYVVGGSVRDALLRRDAQDWDLATDARPDRLLAIFPGAVYEN